MTEGFSQEAFLSRSLRSEPGGGGFFFFFFFSPKTGGRVELFWPALTVCEPKAGLVSGLEPGRLSRGWYREKTLTESISVNFDQNHVKVGEPKPG